MGQPEADEHLEAAVERLAETDPSTGADPSPSSNPPRSSNRWPLSAICLVTVALVVAIGLLIMNVFGLRIWNGDGYDADVGGSVAEWFGAVSTLVAVPAALLFSVRQLQAAGEAIELGRRQLATAEIERRERQEAEQALLRDAVRVRVQVVNLLDAPELATEAEQAAIARLREEYRQRGWVVDAGGASWHQGPDRRSNAEQLAAEPSPLLPKPWLLALECRNHGMLTVTLLSWTVLLNGSSASLDAHTELRPGDSFRRRLGAEVDLPAAHASADTAADRVAAITVIVDGFDAADRPFRIIHSRRSEPHGPATDG